VTSRFEQAQQIAMLDEIGDDPWTA